MIDLNAYLHNLIAACKEAFSDRLLYVGLQGSYLRGEAHERSDIDVMILLDRFLVADMDVYRSILKRIGHFELSCGFICGRDEMLRWNPLEICQIKHTAKDLFGTLTDYLPEATRADEINYCKLSLGNLYHALCHRYIHADQPRNIGKLRAHSKDLFFLIQNIHYLETGRFVLAKRDLYPLVSDEDRAMLDLAGMTDDADFDEAFSSVFLWCRNTFKRLNL